MPFSSCPVTCGVGLQLSSRKCDSPPTKYGGLPCQGEARRSRICETKVYCPGKHTRLWTKVFIEWSPDRTPTCTSIMSGHRGVKGGCVGGVTAAQTHRFQMMSPAPDCSRCIQDTVSFLDRGRKWRLGCGGEVRLDVTHLGTNLSSKTCWSTLASHY